MLKNLFKKGTPEAEVEAIANRYIMTALIQAAGTRTVEESRANLEASRLLRVRSSSRQVDHKKKAAKSSWLRRKVRSWLGIEKIESNISSDLEFIAERLKYSGDVKAKYGPHWYGSLLLLQARQLDELANSEAAINADATKDFESAAQSICQLASKFIDKKENIDNNESTEITSE